jgi:hypothetical protein
LRSRNWPKLNIGDLFELKNDAIFFIFAFTSAGLEYGGIHLAAWNAPFTTKAQRLLWRVSGLTLAVSGPAFSTLFHGSIGLTDF